MLGKLLKHEFRATARTMLPVLGVLLLSALLAALGIHVLDNDRAVTLLRVFAGIFLAVFFIGLIAAWVMAIVVMVSRFYRNLLGNEGYLMFTLPTNPHALVWSKLIVSTVWFLVTTLAIALAMWIAFFSLANLSELDFSGLVQGWRMLLDYLAEEGVDAGRLWLLLGEYLLALLLSCLVTCLHFYAAMSIGHMASNRKVLYSVLVFIGINFAFQILGSIVLSVLANSGTLEQLLLSYGGTETPLDVLRFLESLLGYSTLIVFIQGALMYLATVLSLKKGLNLN